MTTATPQTTNPGTSENVRNQMSLADAIAANLSAGREQEPPAPSAEPSEPGPQREAPRETASSTPTPDVETPEPEEAAQDAPDAEETPDETPASYTLADFADAAELDVDTLLERVQVEVPGKDGATRTATLAEALNGYRWNAANTQRAQELAEQRRTLESKFSEIGQLHERATAALTSQYSELDREVQALEQQYQSVDWRALEAAQNGSYADMQARFQVARDELARRRQSIEQSYETLQKQGAELAERQQAEVMPQRRQEMLERIPEWRDEARYQREATAMVQDVANRFGFTDSDFSNISDPRIIHLLHRYWTLERQAERVPAIEKKLKEAPKLVRPGQRVDREDARTKERRQLAGRLRSTGKRSDFAALVLHGMRQRDGNGRL